MTESTHSRRVFLRSALVTAGSLPLGLTLASCATGGGGGGEEQTTAPAGEVSEDNPFGLEAGSSIEAVIFDGGYQTDYVDFAAGVLEETHDGVTVEVAPTTNIAPELQPRFVGGTPPDLIDNSGAQQIGFNTILPQLEDLTDVIDAPNLEGTTIRDTLYEGALAPGTFGDKFAAINYVLSIYGLWFSQSLFDEHGWTPPTTWEEIRELGGAAQEAGKFLFLWGTEAATYYQTLAIESAIKEGGDEVRLTLENLEPNCWSHDAVQGVFEIMKEIIDLGYFKPGGSGTQFTAAQTQWSLDQEALLYPTGSWIANEQKDSMAENFQLTGIPSPSLTGSPAMAPHAIHLTAGEPFIVPSDAANVAGGKELLRVMLSADAVANFAREKQALTVVEGALPEDPSTAVQSQVEMIDRAGPEDRFTFNFVSTYGMNQEQLPIWNSFLDGNKPVDQLTAELQAITDRIREDDAIEKIEVV
ncbi:N-acetylglucosamine/diacetylchitobiose ABC transporter substrate-binding protein [Georgenia alba]|uniref:N-acetylglucosamine/diacetylchitobiose ABC transporter substrate-binding protein n=1 Tax=Georgenia alba TaxID=2233858 RepID=A0ABW2Q7V6_9MICO